MKENEPGRIRLCDEYEELLEQFLQALTRLKQMRDLNAGVAPGEAEGKIELLLREQEYLGTLSALRSHSQECVLCEETLRVYVNANGGNASTATLSVN